ITSPPHQHSAETTPALRGPTRSTHPPMTAAAEPRKTKNSVYVHPNMEIFQSQEVAVISARSAMSLGQATEVVMPTALDSGSQNTENPYAMPMHRWIASAAGGTSQRLNAGPAMIRSLVRNPADDTNGTDDIGETPCLKLHPRRGAAVQCTAKSLGSED